MPLKKARTGKRGGMMSKAANIERLRLKARGLWVKACKHDLIDPREKFVAFLPGNPWDEKYNKAMERYIKAYYDHYHTVPL